MQISSKRLRDRLSKRQRKVSIVTPSYLQPLFKAHHIPPHHIAPQVKYPRFASPIKCAQGTSIEDLVSPEEHHLRLDELPDKFAIFAPDHHQLRYADEIS